MAVGVGTGANEFQDILEDSLLVLRDLGFDVQDAILDHLGSDDAILKIIKRTQTPLNGRFTGSFVFQLLVGTKIGPLVSLARSSATSNTTRVRGEMVRTPRRGNGMGHMVIIGEKINKGIASG